MSEQEYAKLVEAHEAIIAKVAWLEALVAAAKVASSYKSTLIAEEILKLSKEA